MKKELKNKIIKYLKDAEDKECCYVVYDDNKFDSVVLDGRFDLEKLVRIIQKYDSK